MHTRENNSFVFFLWFVKDIYLSKTVVHIKAGKSEIEFAKNGE